MSRQPFTLERKQVIEVIHDDAEQATQALGNLITDLATSRKLDAAAIHEAIMEWNPSLQAIVIALASTYVDLARWQIMDEPFETRPDPTLNIH